MSAEKLLSESEKKILFQEYHKFLYSLKRKIKSKELTKSSTRLNDFYDELRANHIQFSSYSNRNLTNQIIAARRVEGKILWPNFSEVETYIPCDVYKLVEKSRKSALIAVEIYNKPLVEFRSENYIVMMMVAWTSLFHAIFRKNEQECTETDDNRFFGLRRCINLYNGPLKKEVSENLNFLIDIRDRIVHRDDPIVDDKIFGHCQACLLNFEEILIENFGINYQLQTSLAFSLQFSRKYYNQQYKAMKKYKLQDNSDLLQFINQHESQLLRTDPDIFKSPHYSFRVYMIPKIGKLSKSDVSVEYINYDSKDSETIDNMNKIFVAIKEMRVGGDYYKAGDVCDIVYSKLKESKNQKWKFTASYHHSKCAKYFNIRQGYKTGSPELTDKKYCHYDDVFDQYIYTKDWVNFLVKKLRDDNLFNEIMKTR